MARGRNTKSPARMQVCTASPMAATAKARAVHTESSKSASKRLKVESFPVEGDAYSIKGLTSVLHDVECLMCKDVNGTDLSRIVCRSQCKKPFYVCAKCKGADAFSLKCVTCHGAADAVDDPTATALLLHGAQILCAMEGCEAVVTFAEREEHLNKECDYNVVVCQKPGCQRMYLKKNPEAHIESCNSVTCAYQLVGQDGLHYGCLWEGNTRYKFNHSCSVGSQQAFHKLKTCYAVGISKIRAQEKEICSLKRRVDELQQDLLAFSDLQDDRNSQHIMGGGANTEQEPENTELLVQDILQPVRITVDLLNQ